MKKKYIFYSILLFLTAEKIVQEDRPPVSTVQVVFSSTPLISRKDSQIIAKIAFNILCSIVRL